MGPVRKKKDVCNIYEISIPYILIGYSARPKAKPGSKDGGRVPAHGPGPMDFGLKILIKY